MCPFVVVYVAYVVVCGTTVGEDVVYSPGAGFDWACSEVMQCVVVNRLPHLAVLLIGYF